MALSSWFLTFIIFFIFIHYGDLYFESVLKQYWKKYHHIRDFCRLGKKIKQELSNQQTIISENLTISTSSLLSTWGLIIVCREYRSTNLPQNSDMSSYRELEIWKALGAYGKYENSPSNTYHILGTKIDCNNTTTPHLSTAREQIYAYASVFVILAQLA